MPTKTFERVVGGFSVQTETKPCAILRLEAHLPEQPAVPAKHISIDDLVAEWEQDEPTKTALEGARGWVADSFYEEDGETVRTLRLRKGWPQARLAEALSTSQPHVARIERGTENLAVSTMRKLCEALDVDMNRLNQALKRQEAIAQAKVKSQ